MITKSRWKDCERIAALQRYKTFMRLTILVKMEEGGLTEG